MLEFPLLAAGVLLGAGAILLFTAEPDPPGRPAPAEPAVAIAWRYRTDGPIVSTPVLADGRVIVGSNDRRVHCLSAETGEVVWTCATGAAVEAPPLVVDGRVYVGSLDGVLHAIDAATGEKLWDYATGDAIHGGANWLRTPAGEFRLFVGSHDRKLHCIDAAGGPVWTVEVADYINGAPAVAGDAVIFGGCDGAIHIVDALSGETRHDVPLGDGVFVASSVVAGDGTAYAACVGAGGVAVSIDAGEILWNFPGEDSYFSSPALAPDRVVVAGRDRHLRALDRSSGEQRWSFAARDGMDSSPVIAGDRVIVGSNDGRVHAVALADGAPLWEFALGGPITGTVAVGDGLVFVPCEDGTLYALRARR
jgi:outer membrane protein assembly factor BamB